MSERIKIFVLGYGRSGTTMMGAILGNHPDVYMFRELNFFEKLWDRKPERELTREEAADIAARLLFINRHGFARLKDPSEYLDKGRDIVGRIEEGALTPIAVYEAFLGSTTDEHGKHIPCEQTPGYVFFLPEILELFPEARIINMIRDPRDVLVSRKKKWRQHKLGKEGYGLYYTLRTWAHYHPISSSFLWKAAVKAAQPQVEAGRVLQVRFEDVLRDPEGELRRICDFVGITFYEEMLDVPIKGSSFVKHSTEKVGIDKSRTANWKDGGLNSAELFINQALTADMMRRFRYRPVRVFPNPLLLVFYTLSLPFRMLLTFVLHKKHFKNMRESINKRLLRSDLRN
jgi:hypothetical protein